MDYLIGIFVQALFKATETIWERTFDAAWDPLNASLKDRFLRFAGKDKESDRRKAFSRANDAAIRKTIREAENDIVTKKILDLVNRDTNPKVASALAEEASKVLIFSNQPDIAKMEALCSRELKMKGLLKDENAPPPEAIFITLKRYLDNLRAALMDEPEYNNLIQKEMLKALHKIQNLQPKLPIAQDDENAYLSQLINRYQDLDFVGIPELKDRQSIKIEDIFIKLWAEGEE